MTSKAKTETRPTEVLPQQQLPIVAAPQTSVIPVTNAAALEDNLAAWAGAAGILFAFNGSTGRHRTLLDNTEVRAGTQFKAFLHETRKGWIKFNPDGPPEVRMVRIDDSKGEITREELGDLDESLWPIGLNGQPESPWKEQYAMPMELNDAGGELYVLVSRGVVAMNSAESLLGRWRSHSKRKLGFTPIIRIVNSSYFNKKFQRNSPKPEYPFVDWLSPDGTLASAKPPLPPLPLGAEMNDQIPDFSKPVK
jgi:hypothetical protein